MATAGRLKSRTTIRSLFNSRDPEVVSLVSGCLRANARLTQRSSTDSPILAGYTTNRSLKRAVDRNRAKRLLRSTFRSHAAPLESAFQSAERGLAIMFLYRGDADISFNRIDAAMASLTRQILSAIEPKLSDAS